MWRDIDETDVIDSNQAIQEYNNVGISGPNPLGKTVLMAKVCQQWRTN